MPWCTKKSDAISTVSQEVARQPQVQTTAGSSPLATPLYPIVPQQFNGLQRKSPQLFVSNIQACRIDNYHEKQRIPWFWLVDWWPQRHIDLVIEYQIEYKVANLLLVKFQQAGIPEIAVDMPMTGAIFWRG